MGPRAFLEVIIDARDAASRGLLSRDEVEDPLAEALEESGLGEVSGGGGGGGRYIIDVEVDEERFPQALELIRSTLRGLRAPASTSIKRHKPKEETFSIDAD